MRTFRFYRENELWFVDLPEWQGEKWELEMVMGADTMLELVAQGESEVYLTLGTEMCLDWKFKLEFSHEYLEGAYYNLISELHNFPVWLCRVTKFVFNELPKTIYIK